MSLNSLDNIQSSIKNMRRLPALKDVDTLNRRTLFPLNSSPAKLLQTPESQGRRVALSSSKQKRVASMPKKSSKDFESPFAGSTTLFSKTQSKNLTLVSPKKFMGRNTKLSKLETPKPRNSPPNTGETFNERYQQLQLHNTLPNPEESRCSQKAYGTAKAFGVCTNQGLVRNYNEDRVSIVLEIPRPVSKPDYEAWPNSSIFAIFDGHGGAKCADFLRSSLHYYIARNKWFPTDPEEALKEACEAAERRFIENQLTTEEGKHDTSGSCGLVMVMVEDVCYISNVGDSRAVISRNGGKIKQAVTRDHKPSDEGERTRVLNAGGRIYQNFPSLPNTRLMNTHTNSVLPVAAGPHRILPGGLAVSRAFGDIEAKVPKFGGNGNVLIAKPEITTLKINRSVDFIVMGSDGIFDVLSNEEVIRCVWSTINTEKAVNIHELLKIASENLIKEALLKKSFDNVTVIIVGFPALEHRLNPSIPLQASTDLSQELHLSPKIPSPLKTEGVIPEATEQVHPSPMEKLGRSEKLSSNFKIGGATRTISGSSSRKDLLNTKIKEMNRKDLESLPKIIPRPNGVRPSRLSAV